MKRLKTITKWGLLLGGSEALGTQILTWLGQGLTNWFLGLTYLLIVIFTILSLIELRKRGEIKFNVLNVILIIMGIILISRIIFQIYMFIYTRYIDPFWVETVSEYWANTLQESNIPADQIENQINGFRKSYETFPMFTSSLIFYAVPQFILGITISTVFVIIHKIKSTNKA